MVLAVLFSNVIALRIKAYTAVKTSVAAMEIAIYLLSRDWRLRYFALRARISSTAFASYRFFLSNHISNLLSGLSGNYPVPISPKKSGKQSESLQFLTFCLCFNISSVKTRVKGA